jgi:hypothetical protein
MTGTTRMAARRRERRPLPAEPPGGARERRDIRALAAHLFDGQASTAARRKLMARTFDYAQKILLAVEFTSSPSRLPGTLPGYAVFRRLAIPDIVRAFDENETLFVRLVAGRKFESVLNLHMGYWEERIPAGQQCFVHYAIGRDDVIAPAFERLKNDAHPWALCGVYRTEPQCSAYPASFPTGRAPNTWEPDAPFAFTGQSVFWFNFFPAQPALFEKTFAVWVLFNMFQQRERGECNQLCAWEGKEWLAVNGVDPFVQVNLNRFTSMPGYFNAAHEAGKHTFTVDPDYRWYGMLMRKVG